MAPAERKKVVLKHNKTAGKRDSKERSSEQICSKGEEGRSLVVSNDYEETTEKVGNGEAVKNTSSNSSSSSNKSSSSNNSRNNNTNMMERACSEDRGLRRRPKVFSPPLRRNFHSFDQCFL